MGGAKGPDRGLFDRQPGDGLGGAREQLGSQEKPFGIRGAVWEAYQRVKANKGAAGVDGQSMEEFE